MALFLRHHSSFSSPTCGSDPYPHLCDPGAFTVGSST